MYRKQITILLAVLAALSATTGVKAEVSRRDQDRAAQRAYRASVRDHVDAARGFEKAQRAAKAIRDGAENILLRNAGRIWRE